MKSSQTLVSFVVCVARLTGLYMCVCALDSLVSDSTLIGLEPRFHVRIFMLNLCTLVTSCR